MKDSILSASLFAIVLLAPINAFAQGATDVDDADPKYPDIQEYIDNPDLEIPPPKDPNAPTETPKTRQGRAPAFWSGGKFPEFKTKEQPKEEIIPTSSGYKDTWIGRSAGRPETPPEEVEKAKTEVEKIFEGEYMAPPKESLIQRYAAQVTLIRNGKKIGAFEVREHIRGWIRDDQKRKEKEVMYSLPSYRMEGDSVRVKSTRIEASPRKIVDVSVLFGKTVGTEWRILEDVWNEPAKTDGKK